MKIYEPSLDRQKMKRTKEVFALLFNARRDIDLRDEAVHQFMKGTIDFHIHAMPDASSNRVYDEENIALRACEAGMRAVVFKSHSFPSSSRVPLIQKTVNDWAEAHKKKSIDVFGGVTLNYSVGGLNPDAVKTSAQLGGKFVWTPSIDSAHHYRVLGKKGGIEVITEKGKVVPALQDIFKIIRDKRLILGISHHSVQERFILIKEARKVGIKKIVINHPLGEINKATPQQIKEMARMGAFVLVTYVTSIPNLYDPEANPLEMIEVFRLVGFDRIIGGTELTQLGNPHPVDGLRLFLKILLLLRVSENDVRKMFIKVPSQLLYR
jgi:hypothetical protein